MEQSSLYTVYDRDPAPIVEFIAYVRQSYALPRPGMLLDMGCGPGGLIASLARSDWRVTGYEPDADYAVAAQAALRDVPDSRFRQAGFLELDETNAFDLIAAINGPYSYLIEPGQRREAILRCARALRPGGVLLLEFSNFLWILRNYREPVPANIVVGRTQVRRTAKHDLDYHRGTFTHHDRFEWVDESGVARTATKTHRMAIVSFSELRDQLASTGFSEIRTFNDFQDRVPAELQARRILVTALWPANRPPA